MTKLELALLGSDQAAARVRQMKAEAYMARPVTGHFPFPGHRTVATVDAQRAAARRREREQRPFLKAMEFGLDPDCLKASKR